jgi:IS5 family transposase
MIKVQEAENQIIVAYQVYDQRPADSALLVPAIEQHRQRLGVVPRVAAGDAGFFSAANEKAAEKLGVARVAVPFPGTKSAERPKRQKERWFRKGAALAHRLRRAHQRAQATPRTAPLPL